MRSLAWLALLAPLGMTGCTLLAPDVACDARTVCPSAQVCGASGFCEFPGPDDPITDAGARPRPVLPDAGGEVLETFTSLTRSAASVLIDETVTLTASVRTPDSDGVGVGFGELTFQVSSDLGDTWADLATLPLDAFGEVRLDYIASLDGVVFRGRYLGVDDRLEPSTSAATEPLTVELPENVSPTAVALSGAPTQLDLGSAVTLVVVVTTPDEAGEPVQSGDVTVEWSQGGADWESVASGGLDAAGSYTAEYTPEAAGVLQFRATYNGGELLAPSLSLPTAPMAVVSATFTTVDASPAVVLAGEDLTLTALVTAPDAAGAPVATGQVRFESSPDALTWTDLGAELLDGSGFAVHTHAPTVSGLVYRAVFEATGTYAASSSEATVAVEVLAPTTTTIAPSVTTLNSGEALNLNATVVDDGGAPVTTGQLAFDISLDGGNGWTAIFTAAVQGDGTATFAHTATIDGIVFRARYLGDAVRAPSTSSATVAITVVPPPDVVSTETAVTRSAASITLGAGVNVSATVSTDQGLVDDGTVTVEYALNGGLWIEVSTGAVDASGLFQTSHTPSEPGSFQYRAIFNGGDGFDPSVSPNSAATSVISPVNVAVTRSPSVVNAGSPVTITATVRAPNGSGGLLTFGTVTMQRQSDGGAWVTLNTAALNGAGQRTTTHTPSTANSVAYRAIYNGATFYEARTSPQTPSVTVRHLITRTTTWNATATRSYHGDGNLRTTDFCYQGQFSTSRGNQRCAINFDHVDMRAQLAGSTITNTEIYLFYDHTYLGAGGTARVGTHNSSNPQNTWGAVQGRIEGRKTAEFQRDEGKFLDVTDAIGREFRDGTTRGVIIGPGADNNAAPWYAYTHGATQTNVPKVRITYQRFE